MTTASNPDDQWDELRKLINDMPDDWDGFTAPPSGFNRDMFSGSFEASLSDEEIERYKETFPPPDGLYKITPMVVINGIAMSREFYEQYVTSALNPNSTLWTDIYRRDQGNR